MRVLLTGATGVVGRRAVPLLLEAGHRVTAVGRSADARRRLAAMGAEPIELDLFAPDAVARAVAGHDAVVNLATRIPRTPARMMVPWAWRENDRIRGIASGIIARAARAAGVGRLVQESFGLMYESQGDRWIDERSPVRPARYNRSTLTAERSAAWFTEQGGIGIALRFAGFYGPDPLGRAFLATIRKGWSPLPGPPDAFFSSLAQVDAARAVVAALPAGPGVYNVTDDQPLRRAEYLEALASTLRVAPPRPAPAWVARLMGSLGELMSRSIRMSNALFKRETGWTPVYPSAREGWLTVLRELESPASEPGPPPDREAAPQRPSRVQA